MKKRTLAITIAMTFVAVAGYGAEPSENRINNVLKNVNSQEARYAKEKGKFARLDDLLAAGGNPQSTTKESVSLRPEDLKPYELSITVSADGKHYQAALKLPKDLSDKSADGGVFCKPAGTTDERGTIYIGRAINCPPAASTAATPPPANLK